MPPPRLLAAPLLRPRAARVCVRVCARVASLPQTAASVPGPLFASMEARYASILSSLSDNPGAYNKRIRRGRGPSSGKGKTSGRGQKGQKAHGKVPAGFAGGQTANAVVNPPRGKGKFNP